MAHKKKARKNVLVPAETDEMEDFLALIIKQQEIILTFKMLSNGEFNRLQKTRNAYIASVKKILVP